MLDRKELAKITSCRFESDADGREVLTGLTFRECCAMIAYAKIILFFRKQYLRLAAKHEAAVSELKSERKNVVPLIKTSQGETR